MKILSSEQLRNADSYTIENDGISSLELMEKAANQCVNWIVEHKVDFNLTTEDEIHIFCGKGNNGGDGLVMARLLVNKGFNVSISIVNFSEKGSEDFEVNLQKAKDLKIPIQTLSPDSKFPNFNLRTLMIDAIFGTGLSRPVKGWMAELINSINDLNCVIISIDCPSGLFDEPKSLNEGAIVEADITLTFQSPSLSFFLPESGKYVGDFEVLDIGLNAEFIQTLDTKYQMLTNKLIAENWKWRDKFSHKGSFGHVLMIGGSKGKIGSVVLSSTAALRVGAGLVTLYTAGCGLDVIQTACPEVMALVDEHDEKITQIPAISSYKSIAVGPGMGTEPESAAALKVLIQNSTIPLVIDADALNILAENKTWLAFLPSNSILTPHPGEFKRLVGNWGNDAEMLDLLKTLATKHNLIVVLKGAHTAIACPDGKVYFNSTGNPGMATAGSGDTLTGIIAGLLACQYQPKEAAIMGVYLHGLAGDIAAEELGQESLMAGDIINHLPKAMKTLKQNKN